MKAKLVFAAACAALSAGMIVSGCDLIETVQAEKVLAATVLVTPQYDPNTLFAPDGGLLSAMAADAGIELDAGFLADASLPDAEIPDTGIVLNASDAGPLPVVPPQTVAEVFFGKRNASDIGKSEGVPGATVTLAYSGKSFTFEDKGAGLYQLDPLTHPDFGYEAGARYVLTIEHDGEKHTAECDAPTPQRIDQLRVVSMLPHKANQDLQLTRSTTENVVFTSVMPFDPLSGKAEPTYTDMPTNPLDLIDLVANDARWKTKVITVPGSAFPQPNAYYLVNVSDVRKGTTSKTLFTASVFMIGTADMGLVRTDP